MRKNVLLLAVFALFATTLSAQTYYLYLWKGDYRLGLSAGASYGLNNTLYFIPQQYSSLKVVDGSIKRKVSPIVSFYFGKERKLNSDNLHFGIDGAASYYRDGYSIEFQDTNMNITTVKIKSPNISVEEGVYLSYYPNQQFALTLGGYIYEYFTLGSSVSFNTVDKDGEEALNPIEKFGNDEFGLTGFGLGVQLKLGMTYYFNETFFASAHARYSLPLLSSASIFGENEGTNPKWGEGVDFYQKGKMSSLGIIFTIGFRFSDNK